MPQNIITRASTARSSLRLSLESLVCVRVEVWGSNQQEWFSNISHL